jgi:hypothetical protein
MSFGGQLRDWGDKAKRREGAVFHTAVFTAHKSITVGSPLTGAPGQPVDTGRLRNSWQIVILSPREVRILTSMKYARSIEDGLSYAHAGKPLTLRSQVGGFHSLKLTVANWNRIVEDANRRVDMSKEFGEDDE